MRKSSKQHKIITIVRQSNKINLPDYNDSCTTVLGSETDKTSFKRSNLFAKNLGKKNVLAWHLKKSKVVAKRSTMKKAFHW